MSMEAGPTPPLQRLVTRRLFSGPLPLSSGCYRGSKLAVWHRGFLVSPEAGLSRQLFGGLQLGVRQTLPGRQPKFSPSLGRGDRAKTLPVWEAHLRVGSLACVLRTFED